MMDLSTPKNERLHMAIIALELDLTKELLAQNADITFVDSYGNNAVMLAAGAGHVEIFFNVIATQEFDVDAKDRQGETALMRAAFFGNWEICRKLIQLGANCNLVTRSGQTALMKAAFGPQDHISEVLKLLLDGKANPNVQRPDSETALSIAASRHSLSAVRTLLQHGADAEIKNREGLTPLMETATKCGYLMAYCLVRYGANPATVGPNGQTVTDMKFRTMDAQLQSEDPQRRQLVHLEKLRRAIDKGLRKRAADERGERIDDSDEEREKLAKEARRKSIAERERKCAETEAMIRRGSMESGH
jgi:ankyrin repeat protein